MFNYTVEIDREEDGRWIAEIPELPGVMQYGETESEAISRAEALALRVLADKIEASGTSSASLTVNFAGA